jgi:hypothetical protein
MDRRLLIFILAVTAMLLFGCSGDAKVSKPAEAKPKYSGFPDLKAGMWTETVTKSGSQKVTIRTELIENAPSLSKFQVTADVDGQEVVSQIWTDSDGNVKKYIIKQGSDVMCMDISQVPGDYVPETGDSYPPKTGVSLGTYTTPTGKKVNVAKFSTSSGEAWVSSDVPFGMVKLVSNDKTLLSLYDFGLIGAKSRIDVDDIADCTDMTNVVTAYQQTTYETEDEEDELDYEEYDEDYSTYDSGNIETEVKEAGTGSSAVFKCSECGGMPAAAYQACLAACE